MDYGINDLSTLREMIVKKKYLERTIEEKKRQRDSLTDTLLDLGRIYDKQQEDVLELEKFSFSNLYYTVLGQKKEMLEKEKREVLEAKLKYDSCFTERETLREEIGGFADELRALSGCEEKYEALLVEKRELIAKSDPVLAKEITELFEKAEQLEREEKELSEAMEACETVLRISEEVCQCFSEAKYYAKLDIVSGDSDDTYRKYRWLDRAESLVVSLGIHMGRLKTELCDVRVEWDTKVDISSLTAFTDMWFDNIFTDIAVKKKVYKAADDAGRVLKDIKAVKERLTSMYTRVNGERIRTDATIKTIITKAEI